MAGYLSGVLDPRDEQQNNSTLESSTQDDDTMNPGGGSARGVTIPPTGNTPIGYGPGGDPQDLLNAARDGLNASRAVPKPKPPVDIPNPPVDAGGGGPTSTGAVPPTSNNQPPGATPPPPRVDPAGTPPTAPAAPAGPTDVAIPTFTASDRQAIMGQVDDNQLVQGQLARILASDSPLLKDARGQAMTYANERGLMNSSLAAESGEKAAIESALPIAQQDASTYSRQALTNQDAGNQFQMADKSAENQAKMNEVAFGQTQQLNVDQERAQSRLADQNFQQQKVLMDKDATLKIQLEKMDTTSRETVGAMQVAAAQADAGARLAVAQAQIAAQERMSSTDNATRLQLGNLDAASRERVAGLQVQSQVQINATNLGANAMSTYTSQFNAIATADMSAEDRVRAWGNLNAIWAGSPYLPPGLINPSTFTSTPVTGPGVQHNVNNTTSGG